MRLTLLHELAQFLTVLERTQQDLLTLFTAKREALDRRLSEELLRLSAQEGKLTGKLQELVKERTDLLIKARGAGFAVESLLELAGVIGRTVGDSRVLRAIELIENRINQSQLRTTKLQQ